MPEINSYADILRDWEGLQEALRRNPELLPILEAEGKSLAETAVQVQDLLARQEELRALRQEATQQLRAAVVAGRELAVRVRAVAKGKVGPKNERLVHFRVVPTRKRSRRRVEKPSDGEAPGTVPGASGSPS
jgi:DNA repair protein RadC